MSQDQESLRRKLLRWTGRLAYLACLSVVAVVVAYLAFGLFVRSGVTPVPDLRGLPEAEATDLLADQSLGLRRNQEEDAFDDSIEAGQVLAQQPGSRTLVKRGSTVSVALSLGPQVVEVPDLTGQTAPAAQVTLAASGLALGRTVGVIGNKAAAGTVVEQWPNAGKGVPPETSIDLLISRQSRGETYVMPDLVYRRYEQSRTFFQQRGFRLGSVKYEVYEGIPEGVILRQFPLAGHPLRRQDAIALVVSTLEARSR
ncbi:MAG: PASTA domain-containing protein [Deltaproteobacteria bacterium]|nr:PASTA domain-containing protein [Deltaproteobacteria bacterium]